MKKITLTSSTDPDLSRYTDTLDLLAVVSADPTLSTFIGHWAPPGAPARYIHMYTQLSIAQIELLKDYKPYGTLTLPCLDADASGFLHRQILDLHTHSADPDMLSKLSASIAGQRAEHSTQVQLFGVRVLREEEDGWLVPDGKLVWRWVKPQSFYRTAGAWETSLEKAVNDGEWSAGKGIMILVKCVRDENL